MTSFGYDWLRLAFLKPKISINRDGKKIFGRLRIWPQNIWTTGIILFKDKWMEKSWAISSNQCNWLDTRQTKKLNTVEGFNLPQCFFGEYLLKIYPENSVAIVESEKSAIIARFYLLYANSLSSFIFHFSHSGISFVCKSINFCVWSW